MKFEIKDQEFPPDRIVIKVLNWSDSCSVRELDEYILATYGPGWKRKTLVPPRRSTRRAFGLGVSPVRKYAISVTIKKI